jgi:hypothetical protein
LENAENCCLSGDCSTLIIGHKGGYASIYDLKTRLIKSQIEKPSFDYVDFESAETSFRFLSDSTFIGACKNRIKMYDLRSKKVVKEFRQQKIKKEVGTISGMNFKNILRIRFYIV